jgi:hypothetical protein
MDKLKVSSDKSLRETQMKSLGKNGCGKIELLSHIIMECWKVPTNLNRSKQRTDILGEFNKTSLLSASLTCRIK